MEWNLSRLYSSFEGEDFLQDFHKYATMVTEHQVWSKSLESVKVEDEPALVACLEAYIHQLNAIKLIGSRLHQFASLTLSTDANHSVAKAYQERLGKISKGMTGPHVAFLRWLKSLEVTSLNACKAASPLVEAHGFYLEGLKGEADHLLSTETEIALARIKATGSEAWSQLQAELTANLMVDLAIDGQPDKLPLQSVRNLAFHGDGAVRKAAFEAELAAYEAIEQSSAAALNAIKGEVIVEAELRGFSSPLAKTLFDAKMTQKTLDAMLSAVVDFLPKLRAYQRAKAQYLGHEGGLPFYDIHAPLTKEEGQYSFEQGKAIVLEAFGTFSQDLKQFAHEAFEGNWIDVAPKRGKRSGAFCSGVAAIKESRILLNYTGSLNNVITMAHELGHGYHGRQIYRETPLNGSYSMPVAETASIFCETILKQVLIGSADEASLIGILDTSIQGYAQTIMDIYSRYLFETAIFEARKDAALSLPQIKEEMLKAQRTAYGDALDPMTLHPYMWANKVHYYYPQRNFYNFPYTFGLLFAKGLYAVYQQQGDAFIPKYQYLLQMTGQKTVEEIAALASIDIEKRAFWDEALSLVGQEIDRFIALING